MTEQEKNKILKKMLEDKRKNQKTLTLKKKPKKQSKEQKPNQP